jgi:esterase
MQLHFNKIGNGPALIILHGLYGSGDNWYHIAKHYPKNSQSIWLIKEITGYRHILPPTATRK